MMRRTAACHSSLAVAFVLWLVAASAAAQVPDSGRLAGVMATGVRALQPAQFVLDHRDQLALTPEQVTTLEAVAAAQRDSLSARQKRAVDAMRASTAARTGPSAIAQAMAWVGPVDEEAIRNAVRDQSATQAATLIAVAHDRRAVAALLTAAQVAMLPRLEARDMMRSFNPSPSSRAALPPKGGPYFEFQVEKQATARPGISPAYPDALKAARVEGEVLAQFVVDTTGQVEMSTFHVLKSSHALFTQAVRESLEKMQFLPAEVGGVKVRQIVQQPFVFALPPEK